MHVQVLQVEQARCGSEEERSSNAEYQPLGDIYALGDCCANVEGPLPSLAQVCHRVFLSTTYPQEYVHNTPLLMSHAWITAQHKSAGNNSMMMR